MSLSSWEVSKHSHLEEEVLTIKNLIDKVEVVKVEKVFLSLIATGLKLLKPNVTILREERNA